MKCIEGRLHHVAPAVGTTIVSSALADPQCRRAACCALQASAVHDWNVRGAVPAGLAVTSR
eukprot:9216344-Alexandrium_andersonii.AAC.1